MKISVVIPTYNLEDCIKACLDSVFAQTSPADEVIVIDDGSTDTTVQLVQAYPVRLIQQSNQGPGAARNHGVNEASGDWIAFLDGDDFCSPNRIFELRKAVESHSEAVLIGNDDFEGPRGGPWVRRDLHTRLGAADSRITKEQAFLKLYKGNFLATSGVAVLRSAFLEAGAMDPEFRSAQDFDLWLRIAQLGSIHVIPKPLTYYVARPGSISANVERRLHFSLRIADRYRSSVPRSLYLYRVALCYYEACLVYRRQNRFFRAAASALQMPFAVLKRFVA